MWFVNSGILADLHGCTTTNGETGIKAVVLLKEAVQGLESVRFSHWPRPSALRLGPCSLTVPASLMYTLSPGGYHCAGNR